MSKTTVYVASVALLATTTCWAQHKDRIQFANVTDGHGRIIGAAYMIGKGGQVAFGGSGGGIAGSSGKMEYQANVKSGLSLVFTYETSGRPSTAEFRVADIVFDSRADAKTGEAFEFIDEIKLANNRVDYLYMDDSHNDKEGKTTSANTALKEGKFQFQLHDVAGFPQDQWFSGRLTDQLKGEMTPFDVPKPAPVAPPIAKTTPVRKPDVSSQPAKANQGIDAKTAGAIAVICLIGVVVIVRVFRVSGRQ